MTAELTKIAKVKAKATLPGEVAGAGLALTLVVTNDADTDLDISSVVVTLLDSDDAPGGTIEGAPAKPIQGTIKAGRKATGIYVFTIAENKRKPITVNVTVGAQNPILVFTGDVR